MIEYRKGDATRPEGDGPKLICHICNDVGGWGAGFVLALSRRWKQPELCYRAWHADREVNDFGLGAVQFVPVDDDIWVANMVAQHDIVWDGFKPPIRYKALGQCLKQVALKAAKNKLAVVMPRIGCGLAGGEWAKVGPLVEDYLRDLSVTVYDLE